MCNVHGLVEQPFYRKTDRLFFVYSDANFDRFAAGFCGYTSGQEVTHTFWYNTSRAAAGMEIADRYQLKE